MESTLFSAIAKEGRGHAVKKNFFKRRGQIIFGVWYLFQGRGSTKWICSLQSLFAVLCRVFYILARSNPIKLAAVVLRRRAGCEDIVYRQELVPYSSGDYEVLLRQWPSQPYLDYLAVFSGPVAGTDPEHTLLSNCRVWSAKLAAESGHKKHGIKGRS